MISVVSRGLVLDDRAPGISTLGYYTVSKCGVQYDGLEPLERRERKDGHLQVPTTTWLETRKSEDDMKAIIDARHEMKKATKAEEDKRKENYVRKPIKRRKRTYYCCSCESEQRSQGKKDASQCDRCGHEPCPACLAGMQQD